MCVAEASCFAFDPERPGSICIKKPERETCFDSDIRERKNAQPLIAIQVAVTVKNTGIRFGKEVVELYLSKRDASITHANGR